MIRFRAPHLALLCVATAAGMTACDWMPGKPDPKNAHRPPTEITDFHTLITKNCQGCHGLGNNVGPMIALNSQTFLNLIPEQELRNVIVNGVKGTRMPAFSIANGGGLTDEQIDILVKGILAEKKPLDPAAGPLPPFAGPLGDVARGQGLFAVNCGRCHGVDGKGTPIAGSVVNPAYLGMVSNQYLRTVVISGRPELGMPDFHGFLPGRSLSGEDVSDIVAWLVSHRTNEFGQPLSQVPANPATPATVP